MTVICWDGATVAADSLECYGSTRSAKPVQKLRERKGFIFACTGTGAMFEPLIEWYLNDCPKDQIPQCGDSHKDTKLLVFKGGKAWVLSADLPHPAELYAPDAWGVGADMAIGAMEAGATAAQAVEICIKREVYVGGPVQVIDLTQIGKTLEAA
jgi:hypothetical protein